MPNNYLSVLYKHKIQVENEYVGLKVCVGGGGGGTNIPLPPNQKSGATHPTLIGPMDPSPSFSLLDPCTTSVNWRRLSGLRARYFADHF